MKEELNYVNGALHGIIKMYYNTGKLRFEYTYDNDILTSQKMFDMDENLMKEINYDDDEEYHGLYKVYYRNGNLKFKVNYEHGIKEGLYKDYDIDGYLNFTVYYVNGDMEGLGKTFYPSGRLKSVVNYINGKREGRFCEYYDNDDHRCRVEKNYINDICNE